MYLSLCATLIYATSAVFAVQHPTGFTTVQECAQRGASVQYLLEEPNGAKQFVLTLDHGVVVGEGGIVTIDGKILADTETYKQDQQRLLKHGRDISKEEGFFFNGALAVLSSPGQQCYYHWLLQVLPRLKILHDSKIPYDKIYLYAANFRHRWQKESLRMIMDFLEIPEDKLLLIEHEPIVQAEKLLVPSILWVPSKPEFGDAALQWYTQFFQDLCVQQSMPTPRRIFISRSQAGYRRIQNEAAVMALLKEKGFVSYCLENLSLQEQATLFRNAEIIVGPHGSGWTNLIFCAPNTRIIEIDHGMLGVEQRSSFKGMAQRMGCSYYPFYVDRFEDDTPEDILNQDMVVDLDVFLEFIEKLEL